MYKIKLPDENFDVPERSNFIYFPIFWNPAVPSNSVVLRFCRFNLDEFINCTKWFGLNVPECLELVYKIAGVSVVLNSEFLGFIVPFRIFPTKLT